ncbi:MAG: 50S ribosomal protein L32e [Thermoprotei archaeon]|nr:MAG: 50S ribosomal protein L32e [Thermoprotei archaeon]
MSEEKNTKVEEGEESVDKGKNIPKRPNRSREFFLLLKKRSKMNSVRPRFIRMNSWRLKRLPDSWRSPRRSLDNKIRLQKKGYPALVKVGYRNPKKVRGLHPSGFIEVLVSSPKDLDGIDPSIQAIRISSNVGRRKRAEIIKRAEELGIRILNVA